MTDKSIRDSTILEIKLFKSLSHENIIRCYGYFSKGSYVQFFIF